MKLTISNASLHPLFGEEESLRMIKEAGFDGVDLHLGKRDLLGNHLALAHQTKHDLEKYGLICDQVHATWRELYYGMNFDLSEPKFREVVHCLEYASIIGAKLAVVHGIPVPLGIKSTQSMEYNYQYLKALEPFAKEFGVKVALENTGEAVPYPYQMGQMLKMLDSEWFTVVLDTGHAQCLFVPPEMFIRDLPKGSITGLHVQDMNKILGKDEHLLPGMGKLDWDEILKALVEVEYDGNFNMEVHGFLRFFEKDESLPAALKLSEQVGRIYIKKLEQYKNQ